MSDDTTYTHITLRERPEAHITPTTFKVEKASLSKLIESLGPKQVLVQVQWVSLDPAMRGWLNDARSYVPPVGIGETMRAGGLATVVKAGAQCSKLSIGDVLYFGCGWTEYAVVDENSPTKVVIPPKAELLDFLGPMGVTGLTAYFGLLEIGKPKAGETIVVTGAAGATGSMVCQIAKLNGLKVIAVAGSDDKCAWLENELGVDKAVNYKHENFKEELKAAVGYLDVMFDNVGGDILNLCLTMLNKHARIVMCGAISEYNSKPKGLTSYKTLIAQSAKMEGFIVFNYASQYPKAISEIAGWIAEGKIKRRYHIVEGLEKCPESLGLLFSGKNNGKLVVKVSDPEQAARL